MTDESPLRVVSVNGSLATASKTGVLLTAVADALAAQTPIEHTRINLVDIAAGFDGATRRDLVDARVQQALEEVESADLLLVGTPVFRASFTGLFKHFFDFVDQYALVDVPVLLTATGGSERHALTIEHQLRPLFGFFQALTLPIGVYGATAEFIDGIPSEALQARIQSAAQRSLPFVLRRLQPTVPAFW